MGGRGDDLISVVLIAIVILIVIFLLLRESVCWYWKINKMVDLQEKQNVLLGDLSIQLKKGVSIDDKGKGDSPGQKQVTDEDHSDDDDISRDNLFK